MSSMVLPELRALFQLLPQSYWTAYRMSERGPVDGVELTSVTNLITPDQTRTGSVK